MAEYDFSCFWSVEGHIVSSHPQLYVLVSYSALFNVIIILQISMVKNELIMAITKAFSAASQNKCIRDDTKAAAR